tara:strand:+ start:4308 stop:4964 length:657 start_codon:yes stop_codon:yes gene_type:complete
MINKKGLFITFEGGEASGKTTQINKIKNWFKKNKLPYVLTREPGGTVLAESLRKKILSSKNKINPKIELFLLNASRIDHVNKVILPGLKKKKIVISDRFVDSSAVYQGYYNNLGIKSVYKLHKIFLDNILPDLTFFFDTSNTNQNIVKKRLNRRKSKNKYDLINGNFNKQINFGYLKIAKNNKRFIIIDASLSINEIHAIITLNILKKLSNYGVTVKK